MTYELTIYDKAFPEQIDEKTWNGLLARSASKTIFLTWQWVRSWWEIYGPAYRLYLIAVHTGDGELVGLAPFKLRQKKRLFAARPLTVLEFIGWGERVTPEYLDIIIKTGLEADVLPLIIDNVRKNDMIDVFDLKPISGKTRNLSGIENLTGGKGCSFIVDDYSSCPVTRLPDSWPAYLSSKSKNFRKKMKEFERIAMRDLDFRVELCHDPDDVESSFNTLIALHKKRWGRQSKAFLSRRYIEFHKTVARKFLEKDGLRLFTIFDGDRAVASLYCLYYGDHYYYYQSGRDVGYSKYRLGLVVINKAIQHAISEGAAVFDFLTGEEKYKFRWADAIYRNKNLKYYKHEKDYHAAQLVHLGQQIRSKTMTLLRRKAQ